MMALLQRVSQASVDIEGQCVARIDHGLLVFVGVEKGDKVAQGKRLCERVLGYRIFADDDGRMNRSVADIDGGVLLVPQFTLPADTSKGMRPGLSPAADSETGRRLFDDFVRRVQGAHPTVCSGRFQADMQVHLSNDGPVTSMLRVSPS